MSEEATASGSVIKAVAFLKTLTEDHLSLNEIERLSAMTDSIAAPVLVLDSTDCHFALVAQRPVSSLREASFVDWMNSLEFCCQSCTDAEAFSHRLLTPDVGVAPLRALWEKCGAALDTSSDEFWMLDFSEYMVILEYNAHIGRARFRTLVGEGSPNSMLLRQLLNHNLSLGGEPYFSIRQGLVWLNTPFFVEGEDLDTLLATLNTHQTAYIEATALFASKLQVQEIPGEQETSSEQEATDEQETSAAVHQKWMWV